ncbi:S-layer homology domain-containing protein [Bacillus sp. 22475]|nr:MULTISPECIES: S-layer homology domain-containing protein [Bacillus cereus group]MDA2518627.1 S-layer homology domain-containing protein [Bacillus cereus]MED3183660.1 S-layer homology domain-containing protein [Bacillus thuringiensis]
MNKLVKFSFILFLSMGLLFSNFQTSFASEKDDQIITKEEAQQKAEIYIKSIGKLSYSPWINASLSESKALNDLKGNVRGYLFQVQKDKEDYGYVIVNSKVHGSSIIESTRKGSNPYKDIPEGQAIYTGPIQYLKKVDNKVTHLPSGNTQNVEDIKIEEKNNIKAERNNLNKNSFSGKKFGEKIILEDVYNDKEIENVPDYMWYRGCTPTAVANVIVYWSNQNFPNLFNIRTEYVNSLIDRLAEVMHTTDVVVEPDGRRTGGATYFRDMVPGIEKYWNSHGYPVIAEFVASPTFEQYKNEIKGGRPILLNTKEHPTYINHNLTGIAYEEVYIADLNEKFQNMVVRDTWSPETPAEVRLDYKESAPYLDSAVTVNPFVFSDVPKGHWSYQQISAMAGNKIMNGYGNGYFGATDNITREQMAALLYRYLKPGDTNDNPYVDIKDSPFKKEISALAKKGIFSVNSEKKFNPKNTATRAEIASVLTKVFNLKVKADYEFNDMKNHWANEYVKAIYSNGIANGTGNRNFSPNDNVTREQMAVFLYRAMYLDPNYIPTPI